MYSELTTDHPIDLCRYQLANGYMGRVGLINAGGESRGESDLHAAVVTAVVNKLSLIHILYWDTNIVHAIILLYIFIIVK